MYNLNDDVLFMNLLVKINSLGSYHIEYQALFYALFKPLFYHFITLGYGQNLWSLE